MKERAIQKKWVLWPKHRQWASAKDPQVMSCKLRGTDSKRLCDLLRRGVILEQKEGPGWRISGSNEAYKGLNVV